MSESLHFLILQLSLLAVVLVLHTYIGLHIVRRTLIFSDLVLDQLAALGALVGLALGIGYATPGSYLVSTGMVLIGAGLLAGIKPTNPLIPREAVIGTLYAVALLASLLVGDKLSGGEAYVNKTLAGAMVWVSWPLVAVTVGVYAALLLFHYAYRDKFIALAEGTAAKERWWDFLLFATQGIITILIVPIAGVLLAYAFLMIPAAIAAMFTRRWGRAVAIGWGVGFGACAAGCVGSWYWGLPYGPTLILALGAAFLVAMGLRAARRERATD